MIAFPVSNFADALEGDFFRGGHGGLRGSVFLYISTKPGRTRCRNSYPMAWKGRATVSAVHRPRSIV